MQKEDGKNCMFEHFFCAAIKFTANESADVEYWMNFQTRRKSNGMCPKNGGQNTSERKMNNQEHF